MKEYSGTNTLAKLSDIIKGALDGKQDSLSPGDGITIEDGTISVTTPVKGMTKEEYKALSDTEKQADVLYIVSGPSPDSGKAPVPTGAVISFLALSAPSGYLICDGTEHLIAKYQNLADYIEEQFGSSNYFGGDGETTFAVPDMRNLFLRGYHGEAEEQLSGEIGQKQEGTSHQYFSASVDTDGGYVNVRNGISPLINFDTKIEKKGGRYIYSAANLSNNGISNYTSRPVNMAVLYCIKT